MERSCSISGCGKKHYGRGYCGPHWKKFYRHGDPRIKIRHPKSESVEKFCRSIAISENGECLEWTGPVSGDSYAVSYLGGRQGAVHRWVMRLIYGNIPAGKEVDHICRNRRCVNPVHLRFLTKRENILIGSGPPALNKKKTHCPKGHEYSAENTKIYRGYRYCRACQSGLSYKKEELRRAVA